MKTEMEKKMTTDSHRRDSRGSERDHNRRKEKEDAKENGILKQWTDEECEKEKAEIAVHLKLLMELLQESVKDQSHGWA